MVTKLDRLARSLPDARDILEGLTARQVKLSIGGSVHDPTTDEREQLAGLLRKLLVGFERDQRRPPGRRR